MPVTIIRPFDGNRVDTFEIVITLDTGERIILHPYNRPASDRILIALLEGLSHIEHKP